MTHFEAMLARHDAEAARLLSVQEADERSAFCGAFIDDGCQADTRACGFALAHLAVSYLILQSRYYHDPGVRGAIERAFAFLFANQRPGGCLDLSYCKRNFIPTSIEETARGFRLSARADSWYYLPYDGDGPATSDWWAMDNAGTRKRLVDGALTTTVEVSLDGGGAEVRVRAEGLSGVPIRLEWGFLPGCRLRNEHFMLDATPGGSMTVCGGRLQATDQNGDCITIGPAFARHSVRTRMGGAYPLSENHFTAFFTDYSPFERVIRVDAKPAFGLSMR